MHISIDILVEAMVCPFPHEIEVIHREERRIIATIAQYRASSPNELEVVSGADLQASDAAEHVLVVIASGDEVPELSASSAAIMRTGASVEEVRACACSALVSLSNWDSRLLEAIAARQPLDAILQVAEERLANPVALFDSKLALLAYAGTLDENTEGTIWEDVLLNRFSPIEYYTRDEQLNLARTSRKAWPTIIRPTRDPRFNNLSRAIIVNGQVMGSIGQVDVTSSFTPGQIALADLVTDRLQIALSLRLSGGSEEDDTDYLLRSVLNGSKADKGLAEYHLKRLGWNEGAKLRLLVCASGNDITPEEAETSFKRIANSFSGSPSILYEGKLVTLIANADPAADARLTQLLRKLGKRCAVSEPFMGISHARTAFDQCCLVLAVHDDVAWDTTPIMGFSDAFASVLRRAIDPAINELVLCDPRIMALATEGHKGDRQRGEMLVRELYAFLMNGCNARLTAQQLFMNRNTLLYQIEQLENLLNCKITELSAPKRLFLIVSCLIALPRG